MKNTADYLKEYYNHQLVDEAVNYASSRSIDTLIDISLIGIETSDEGKKEIAKNCKHIIDMMTTEAFVDGAQHAVMTGLQDYRGEIKISEYVKSKDLCVMLDFHDNDFGGYLEEAAQIYADMYNQLLSRIQTYEETDCKNMLDNYIEDLVKLESPENIQKTIASGFISSYIRIGLLDWYKEIKNPDEMMKDAYDHLEYLGINDTAFRIGTYSEIENYVMEHYKSQQSTDRGEGQSLKTCWLNGEVLFMSIVDGWMKVWIQ